jgi:hypothetical protein
VKLFIAHLPQGGSLLPCGLYSSRHLKGNGCDLIWYYTRIFLEGLKRTMTNPCNAASLKADVWIQDLQYLKQRSASAFHTHCYVWPESVKLSIVLSIIASWQLLVCLHTRNNWSMCVSWWTGTRVICIVTLVGCTKASFLILFWLREGSTMMMITSLVAWTLFSSKFNQ